MRKWKHVKRGRRAQQKRGQWRCRAFGRGRKWRSIVGSPACSDKSYIHNKFDLFVHIFYCSLSFNLHNLLIVLFTVVKDYDILLSFPYDYKSVCQRGSLGFIVGLNFYDSRGSFHGKHLRHRIGSNHIGQFLFILSLVLVWKRHHRACLRLTTRW